MDSLPKTTRVLLVEDDKFLRELMTEKLKSSGFEVIEASDGEEGLNKIKKELPDIVLLDLILPGMDGFSVLKAARKDPECAKIPIIVLSNLGQKEDIDRVVAAGGTDYLIKANFTPGDVVSKIESLLGT